MNEDVFAQPCTEEQALPPSVQELAEQIHRLLLQVGAQLLTAHTVEADFSHTAPSPGVPSSRRLALPCILVPVFSSTAWAFWAKSVPGPDCWAQLLLAQFRAAPALHFWCVCLSPVALGSQLKDGPTPLLPNSAPRSWVLTPHMTSHL